jgi:hypothetical protein
MDTAWNWLFASFSEYSWRRFNYRLQPGWSNGNALDLYLVGAPFEFSLDFKEYSLGRVSNSVSHIQVYNGTQIVVLLVAKPTRPYGVTMQKTTIWMIAIVKIPKLITWELLLYCHNVRRKVRNCVIILLLIRRKAFERSYNIILYYSLTKRTTDLPRGIIWQYLTGLLIALRPKDQTRRETRQREITHSCLLIYYLHLTYKV